MEEAPDRSPEDDDAALEAFVAALNAHRHRLYAFIAKQLVSTADAEDVFSKSCVVLWKKRAAFTPGAPFFPWACGIAHHEVRNFLRVRRREKLCFDTPLVDLLAAEAEAEADLSQARLEALRVCIKGLGERQRKILARCYGDGASIAAVAEAAGLPRGALYKRLARLREKLLDCIRRRLRRQGWSA